MRRTGPEDELVLPTSGACMRPWIWPGGQLRIKRCTARELRVGDIAVWFDGDALLSHRVLAIGADGRILTRGDLRAAVDSPVEPSQLLGRAVSFRRGRLCYALDGPLARGAGRALARLAPPAAQALATLKRLVARSGWYE